MVFIYHSTIVQSRVLPAKPAVFYGRENDLDRLVAHTLTTRTAPLAIMGAGGIGKTTLALKVLHDSRVRSHFSKNRFFVSCDGASGTDAVLGQLSLKLDVQKSKDESLWSAIIDNIRSRQRTCLVLDNFESIWSPKDASSRDEAEVFLTQLAVLEELTLIVTMRGNHLPESFDWANASTAELDTLSSTAARQTFNDLSCIEPNLLSAETEANALTKLLQEVDFMPLAITLLARLDDLPSRLLREWSEHYTEVLEADWHDGTRRELSVEVSIKISLAHLPAETADFQPRQLLSVFGQLPAGLFPGVSTKLQPTIFNLDSVAQVLLRHSLVYAGGRGGLRMLSPVRHYVSRAFPMPTEIWSAIERIYLDISRAPPSDMRTAIDGPAYDVEIPNLYGILIVTAERPDPGIISAIFSLANYCTERGHSCLQLLQRLLPNISQASSDKAECLLKIAAEHWFQGDWEQAANQLEISADLFATLGEKSRESLARYLLAEECLRKLGRHQEADRQMAKCQQLFMETSDWSSLAPPPPGLDPTMSVQHCRDARQACLQAGDGSAVAVWSHRIMQLLSEQGDEEAYARELQVSQSIGEEAMPGSQWHSTTNLQIAYQCLASGDLDRAESLLLEAYTSMTDHNDQIGTAATTYAFSQLRWDQRRFEEAIELCQVASKLYRKCGDTALAEKCEQHAAVMSELAATPE